MSLCFDFPVAALQLLRVVLVAILFTCFELPAVAGELPVMPGSDWSRINGPCGLRLPEDHAPHPEYLTEWWYYTGNMDAEDGGRYGFQLTFFRRGIVAPVSPSHTTGPASNWRAKDIYLAHAALTDIKGNAHHQFERTARAAAGLAGAVVRPGVVEIFLSNWFARITPRQHVLHAVAPSFSFYLDLEPSKPAVLHGDAGYSMKGDSAESASCYYSMTRLKSTGTLTVSGKQVRASGTAWMDHEFSSAPLESGIVGWDWFSIQLDNDSELMIYLLRLKGGGYHSASSGTFVKPAGVVDHLGDGDIQVEVLDHWQSPNSGASYPSAWRIRIQRLELDLNVKPSISNQEMRTPESTRVTYWEGSVTASGREKNGNVAGVGYVELTGYAGPLTGAF